MGYESRNETVQMEISAFEMITIKKTPIRDEYNVGEKLGAGGFGKVVKGMRKKENTCRAIKQISKKGTDAKAFRQELEVSACLDHPSIIKLFEVYDDRYYYYLVLELCEGGELFDAIVNHKFFNEQDAARVMNQALAGVNYMHTQRIAHRDIKAENFLLVSKTQNIQAATIKIVDFGLAKRCKDGEYFSTCMGTAMYVAPQVLEQKYTKKCDLWSLGVLLYIMLSGEPPFIGRSNSDTLQQVKQGTVKFRPEYWAKISDTAKEFVRQLLTYSEKDRISAESSLNSAWIVNLKTLPEAGFAASHLKTLKDFSAQNKLKRAALQIIARRLTEKDVKELKEAFLSLDKNEDGVVTYQELKDGVQKLDAPGMNDLLPSLQGVLETLDSNGTATLDYSEFLAATLTYKSYEEDSILWGAFCVFDKDQSGEITRKELTEVLKDDGVKNLIGSSCIDQVLKECDTSGDGSISFDEFKAMMLGESSKPVEATPAETAGAASPPASGLAEVAPKS